MHTFRNMFTSILLVLLALLPAFGLDIQKIRTTGKPRVCRFELVDKAFAAMKSTPPADGTALTFGDIFLPDHEDAYFPLTNQFLSTVDTSTLEGLEVFDNTGYRLGIFDCTYPFTREGEHSYTLICFQYKNDKGDLRRSGSDLLLDRFRVRWSDLRSRPFRLMPPPAQ